MAPLVADMTMSLDGFIALPNDDVGPLFDWYRTVSALSTEPRGPLRCA